MKKIMVVSVAVFFSWNAMAGFSIGGDKGLTRNTVVKFKVKAKKKIPSGGLWCFKKGSQVLKATVPPYCCFSLKDPDNSFVVKKRRVITSKSIDFKNTPSSYSNGGKHELTFNLQDNTFNKLVCQFTYTTSDQGKASNYIYTSKDLKSVLGKKNFDISTPVKVAGIGETDTDEEGETPSVADRKKPQTGENPAYGEPGERGSAGVSH
ncbi:MAG: hypothetical protein A2583_04650 [Bdellovibrionales bacterium RIFOXYD1_FULL_53_11]|nr:MAG: hypothetical protein A2583_04650 [Bdellovibrionales bacterium RIFOXYD1_FULL_53_11]